MQPDPANKQSIIHILGMLSSLFTTLDINRPTDGSEGAANPRLPSSQTTHNPVSSGLECGHGLFQKALLSYTVSPNSDLQHLVSTTQQFAPHVISSLGCGCVAAGVHVDPDPPQQMAP